MTAAAAIAFLFSPPPAGEDLAGRFYIPRFSGGGMLVAGDARSYLFYSGHLDRLLEKDSMRQSRPLYILAGEGCGLIIHHLLGKRVRYPYFWGYLALNFALLDLSLVLIMKIFRLARVDLGLSLAAAPLLAFNNQTKNFIYTPHEQMLIILTPLLAVYLTGKTLNKPGGLTLRDAVRLGLGVGVLGLAYGNFFLLGPCLLAAACLRLRTERRLSARGLLLPAAILLAAIALPTLLWVGITTLTAGRYYNYEMAAFRQLVWVLDAARLGPKTLALVIAGNTGRFLETFADLDVALFPLLALAGIGVSRLRAHSAPPSDGAAQEKEFRQAASIAIIVFLGFFWILGYYQPRLTFSLAPPALILIITDLNRLAAASPRARAVARAALAVGVAIWCPYHVFSYGPFY